MPTHLARGRKSECNMKTFIWLTILCFAGAVSAEAKAAPAAQQMTCKKESTPNLVKCSFTAPTQGKVTSIKVEVSGGLVKPEAVSSYPAKAEQSAILFLLDVSDPLRAQVVRRNVDQVRKLVSGLKPHQKAGLAVFDSKYSLLAPIGSSPDKILSALDNVKAGGAATEFYKNLIAASKTIQEARADRRVLVLFSDGKAEDSAYSRQDAAKSILNARIALVGLGFATRPSQTPALQTMARLAEDTGGEFVAADQSYQLPSEFMAAPFQKAESGGSFVISAQKFFGEQPVLLRLMSNKKQIAEVGGSFDANAGRSIWQNLVGAILFYWLQILLGASLIALIFAIWRYRKKSSPEVAQPIEYGRLEELDGKCSNYVLNRKAVRLGRGEESDVQMFNDSVSRNHAELHLRDDGWYLVDLGSTNGSRINNSPISNARVNHNDTIEIGEVRFRFIEY